MPPHLLRCQGFAVADYSFTLGRLEAGAPSTFAQLGLKNGKNWSIGVLHFKIQYSITPSLPYSIQRSFSFQP